MSSNLGPDATKKDRPPTNLPTNSERVKKTLVLYVKKECFAGNNVNKMFIKDAAAMIIPIGGVWLRGFHVPGELQEGPGSRDPHPSPRRITFCLFFFRCQRSLADITGRQQKPLQGTVAFNPGDGELHIGPESRVIEGPLLLLPEPTKVDLTPHNWTPRNFYFNLLPWLLASSKTGPGRFIMELT